MATVKISPARSGSAKDAIRAAAVELFARKGYTATSTREICQRAGITKPVLYYHFGNKEQLYQELVLDAYKDYQRELHRAAHRSGTPREKLVEVLMAIFAFVRRRHNYWRIGFRMVFAPETESPAIDYVEMGQSSEKLLAEVVREGIRQGALKGKPPAIAGAIMGMATSCIMGYLLVKEPSLDRATARNLVDLILKGCAAKPTDR
jgi:AcrR family transcriptional regulator